MGWIDLRAARLRKACLRLSASRLEAMACEVDEGKTVPGDCKLLNLAEIWRFEIIYSRVRVFKTHWIPWHPVPSLQVDLRYSRCTS